MEFMVSIIIPTYNRAQVVCDCIRSIMTSTYKNLEIIIVDNNSDDNTCLKINEEFSHSSIPVKIIELNMNMMAAGGRNAGIKEAKGDYYLFIDNDNLIYPDMIERLVDAINKDKLIGMVGPLSLCNGKDEIWLTNGNYNFYTSKNIALNSNINIDQLELDEWYDTCYIPNIFMLKKEVIQLVGGLDPIYYAMFEEADLGYRVIKAGFKCRIISSARTIHRQFVSKGDNQKLRKLGIEVPERAWHFAKNRSIFEKKYAKIHQQIVYFLIFVHLFTIFYCIMAIKEKRYDIMWAWFRGTWEGILMPVSKNIKIDIYGDTIL